MRNVTISLDDEVARWVRIRAAEEDASVSRFLSRMLRERMEETASYDRAMARNLERKPVALKTAGDYPSRDEVHSRSSRAR